MTDQFTPIERKRKSSSQTDHINQSTSTLPNTSSNPPQSTPSELMHPTSLITSTYSTFQAVHDLFQLSFHPSIQHSHEHIKYERLIQLRNHILINNLTNLLHSNIFNDYTITLPIDPTKTLYNFVPSGPIAIIGAAYLGVFLQSTESPS
jgi:hypothetical protein